MRPALFAALAYFAVAFAAGFALGAIRTLALEPALGRTWAVAIETPFVLTASWLVCAWSKKRFKVEALLFHRLLMGGAALILLLTAETILGLAFGRSLSQQAAAYREPGSILGLAAQLLFGAFPIIQLYRTR